MSDLLSGVIKQVTSNISTYEIRKTIEKVQGMVMNYTETETSVREATNEDPWGPTGPQMKEISNLTFQYDGFQQVMETLWRRMFEDNKFAWRRVYKSLQLLNYLLSHGSERVIGNAKDHVFKLRSLEQYHFTDEKGVDQGKNIRHRAGIILGLLNDDDDLRAERKKAKNDNKEKYQGYTSDDIRMGRGGGFNSSSSYRDTYDDYKKSDDFDDRPKREREVNSFAFNDETRRNSASPELGFRDDKPVEEDDGFGDFAQARTTSSQNSTPSIQTSGLHRASASAVPALPPPGSSTIAATAHAPPANSFDLLGLDAPSAPVQTSQVDFFSSAPIVQPSVVRPPRPPSGGSFSGSSATAKPALMDDLFGETTVSPVPTNSANIDLFGADWNQAAPVAVSFPSPNTSSMAPAPSSFASFDAFASFPSAQPVTPAPTPVTPQTTNNSLNDMFADFGSITLTPAPTVTPVPSVPSSGSSPSATAQAKSSSKVGSTWSAGSGGLADLGGLINLDNLAGKGGASKPSLSLNQMQQGKQGTSNNNLPW